MIFIFVNTFTLALDKYPLMDKTTIRLLDYLNYLFTSVFTIEAVLKIIGLGVKEFCKERFNIFDAVVVIISLVELVISDGGGGAVSALRAFRLFRIVKLARSWESLKLLIDSIAHTVAAIGNFTVLLGLFMYVYSLLGM